MFFLRPILWENIFFNKQSYYLQLVLLHKFLRVDYFGGAESRWQNRKTWSWPLHTSTSGLHLKMEQFSQNTCWTLAEDLEHLKGQEESPRDWVGWKKGNRTEHAPLWRELKERRGSHTQGSRVTGREIIWDRDRVSGTQRRVQQLVCGRTEWDLYRRSMPQPCVPQPEKGVCWCGGGLGAGMWGMESRPGKGTAVGWEETAWGDGSEELHNQECSWRKPRLTTQKQSATVKWCARGGAAIAVSLLTCWPLPLWALQRAPTRAGLHAPAIASSTPPHLGDPITAWRGLCALANSGTDSSEWNTCRDGAEATAEPQRPCD